MYHGEVNITQEKLNHFLDLAERLQVRVIEYFAKKKKAGVDKYGQKKKNPCQVRGLTSGGDKPKRQQQLQQQQQTTTALKVLKNSILIPVNLSF